MSPDPPHPSDPIDHSQSETTVVEKYTTEDQRRVLYIVLKAGGYLATAVVVVGVLATETVLLDAATIGFSADYWRTFAIVALVAFVAMALLQRTLEEEENRSLE